MKHLLEEALENLIEGETDQAEKRLHEYYVEKTKYSIKKQELLERYLDKTPFILSLPGQSPYQTTQLMTKFSSKNYRDEESIGDTPFVIFYTEEEQNRFIDFLKSQGIKYENHGEKTKETGNTVSPVPKF